MYCKKCGSELPPGADSCAKCGSRVEQPGGVQPERSNPPGGKKDHNFSVFHTSKHSKQIIGISALAAVVLVGVLAAVVMGFSSSKDSDTLSSPPPSGQQGAAPSPSEDVAAPVVSDDAMGIGLPDLFGEKNTYVCLSNGKYMLISDENEDGSTYIADSDDKGITYNMVMFSKDKKYIYYYTNYDNNTGLYTLCRADINGNYIETIATNALTDFSELNDGSILYLANENELRYWKEGITTQISNHVDNYYIDDLGHLVYTIGNDTDGLSIYGVDLDNAAFSRELATNCFFASQKSNDYHTLYADFDHILYRKNEDDNTQTLYVVDFNGASKEIAEKIDMIAYDIDNNASYFIADNGRSINLYNFVKEKYGQEIFDSKLREELQNTANNYPLHTLYCYKNGTLTIINENVLSTENCSGGIIFNTPDVISKTGDISSITSVSDVVALFEINYTDENYVVIVSGGTCCQISASAAKTISEKKKVIFYFDSQNAYLKDSSGFLSVAEIDQGTVSDFSIISDKGSIQSMRNNSIYYIDDIYEDNENTYCSLYLYQNRNNTLLAEDVIWRDINIYNDDIIMAYTDYQELAIIDGKGKKNIIADGVTQYIRSDKSALVYISNGDLYLYNGKEKKLLQSDVDWIWSANYVPISYTLLWTRSGYDQSRLYKEFHGIELN